MQQSPEKQHIRIIDFLRGFAALGVVLLHFGNGGLPTTRDNSLSDLFYYGQFGVHIFFVISGFIIPYSLHRSGYTINNYFKQIARRFVRIDPPAYVSILLIYSLYFASIIINGRPIEGREWPGNGFIPIFANLTYTADYLDTTWYNPVFWTLAIEFQFYLLIGLLFPVLSRSKTPLLIFTLVTILAFHWLPFYSFFTFGTFFVMGFLVFLEKENRITSLTFYLLMLASICVALLKRDLPECAFAVAAVIFIRHVDFETRFTTWLGKISFSLYLTHLFTGWVAEIIVTKFIFVPSSDAEKLLMLLVYVTLAAVAAEIFYRLIELPCLQLSKKIRWKNIGHNSEKDVLFSDLSQSVPSTQPEKK